MKKQPKKGNDAITDFLFESGMLSKTPRSWTSFLGSGEQSVAEHINRVCYIAFALAEMSAEKADKSRILEMCLFHDFAEARVSDLNYVHQKYNTRHEDSAVKDLVSTLPFGEKVQGLVDEYEERKTLESQIVKDADNLEFLISLKEQADVGNIRVLTWIDSTVKRLKTKEAKELAKNIIKTDSDRWWIGDQNDPWWVNRNKK